MNTKENEQLLPVSTIVETVVPNSTWTYMVLILGCIPVEGRSLDLIFQVEWVVFNRNKTAITSASHKLPLSAVDIPLNRYAAVLAFLGAQNSMDGHWLFDPKANINYSTIDRAIWDCGRVVETHRVKRVFIKNRNKTIDWFLCHLPVATPVSNLSYQIIPKYPGKLFTVEELFYYLQHVDLDHPIVEYIHVANKQSFDTFFAFDKFNK